MDSNSVFKLTAMGGLFIAQAAYFGLLLGLLNHRNNKTRAKLPLSNTEVLIKSRVSIVEKKIELSLARAEEAVKTIRAILKEDPTNVPIEHQFETAKRALKYINESKKDIMKLVNQTFFYSDASVLDSANQKLEQIKIKASEASQAAQSAAEKMWNKKKKS